MTSDAIALSPKALYFLSLSSGKRTNSYTWRMPMPNEVIYQYKFQQYYLHNEMKSISCTWMTICLLTNTSMKKTTTALLTEAQG